MGTVAGIRTRRYHGLLNDGKPTHVWLSALEDALTLEGQTHQLACHRYPGTVSPKGYELLGEFRLVPYPTWLYQIDEATLIKEVLLIDGSPSVLVRYCCSENATLTLRPFLAGRPQHSLVKAHQSQPWDTHSEPGYQRFTHNGSSLHIRSDAAEFYAQPDWYFNFQYSVDQSRGLDFEEDLFTPGLLRFNLRADTWAYLVCSLNEDPGPLNPLQLLRAIEAKETRFPAHHSLEDRLSNAAEHFLQRNTVIAGYPWFTDWGRDTFISLPGLFLARNRFDDATRTIENFLSLRQDGLIPNRITDDGSTPEYNSVDATLWLFVAVWQWIEAGGDSKRFLPELRDILLTLVRGTRYQIYCDPADGLLHAGDSSTQLTWMDARINGIAVTPRHGKPVEINALWYNALRMMSEWTGDPLFITLANNAISGFTESFWNQDKGCLYDIIGDPAIRPNQLFALSLPYPLVIRSKAESILEVVERDLLTPMGLRTLAPSDPAYRPRFEGGPLERDYAYHQGTVWPWLLGPYVRACLRVRGPQPGLRELLVNFAASQLDKGCLGQLPEVFDAEQPQREGGTPAQAWSVAEILWLLRKELAS
jgi:predicted glycogen debranching enzyme